MKFKVYRKEFYENKPVVAINLYVKQWRIAYMLKECISTELFPKELTTQSKAKMNICGEKWYVVKHNNLTPNKLGVGPWDWLLGMDIKLMSPSKVIIILLL